MSEDMHPGKMHIYNARGYCWCGTHRDDGLSEAICKVLQKKETQTHTVKIEHHEQGEP